MFHTFNEFSIFRGPILNKGETMSPRIKIILILSSFFMMAFSFAARIDGHKFHDLNGNGVDDNEPRLAGFHILLESVANPEFVQQKVTNHNGFYAFTNLLPGAYDVCEVAPEATPPWIPTTPECVRVNLVGKNSYAHVRFGNWKEEVNGIGCTRTQGYWGNSPAGKARVPQLVPVSMNLGTIAYTAAQLAVIFNTPPAGGNALISLAHQLIAAKLNLLAGSDSSQIAADITSADDVIESLVVGSDFVSNNSTLGQQMDVVKTKLDNYNNGLLNVPHCN
jgi:hypothetical protein